MKESYKEQPAIDFGHKPYAGSGDAPGVAWGRGDAGQPLSSEIKKDDLRRPRGSRVVSPLDGTGLRQPRLADPCLGFDGQPLPSAAGNAGSEFVRRNEISDGALRPSLELPAAAARPRFPRPLQGCSHDQRVRWGLIG